MQVQEPQLPYPGWYAEYHFVSLLLELENDLGNQWHLKVGIEQANILGEEKYVGDGLGAEDCLQTQKGGFLVLTGCK